MDYDPGTLSSLILEFREKLHREFRCFYCGARIHRQKTLWKTFGVRSLTIDHVIPLSKHGKNDKTNRVFCCRGCNQAKRSMSLEEFRMVRHNSPDVEFFFETALRMTPKSGLPDKPKKQV